MLIPTFLTHSAQGMYESEERAVRACQQAIRLRNLKNPLEIADAKVPLLSHYRIVIISQVFRRKTQQERLDIVFEVRPLSETCTKVSKMAIDFVRCSQFTLSTGSN